MAAVTLAALTLPLAITAQTTYHDPQGRFDLMVPVDWQISLDKNVDQVVVRKGAVQAIVAVLQQDKYNAIDRAAVRRCHGQRIPGPMPNIPRASERYTHAGWCAGGLLALHLQPIQVSLRRRNIFSAHQRRRPDWIHLDRASRRIL